MIPPSRGILWPNEMICIKQTIVESETGSRLLACKVTVIHQK